MNSEIASAKKKKRFEYFWYDFIKVTGGPSAWLWIRPKVYHVGDKTKHAPKGGVLIVSNHIGFMDVIQMMTVFWRRRLHFLATSDLYKNKLLTWFWNQVHCIRVDKQNFSMRSFHTVADRLKAGQAVTMFPEGSVNLDGNELRAFKSGVVLMAHIGGAPILPVYLVERKKWYHRSITVVGDPIDLCEVVGERPSMAELNAANEYLHERELELERYYHEQIAKDWPIGKSEKNNDNDETKIYS